MPPVLFNFQLGEINCSRKFMFVVVVVHVLRNRYRIHKQARNYCIYWHGSLSSLGIQQIKNYPDRRTRFTFAIKGVQSMNPDSFTNRLADAHEIWCSITKEISKWTNKQEKMEVDRLHCREWNGSCNNDSQLTTAGGSFTAQVYTATLPEPTLLTEMAAIPSMLYFPIRRKLW